MNKLYSIGIIGRTNAGKSTLINTLTKQKMAAVSKTVNTTRKPIRGLMEWKNNQLLLFDSPGVCRVKTMLDKVLVRNLHTVVNNSSIIWFMVEIGDKWKQDLLFLLDLLKESKKPIFLLINKIDRKEMKNVADYILQIQNQKLFQAIIPISAKKDLNLKKLLNLTIDLTIKSSVQKNTVVDRLLSEEKRIREVGNEIIREQIIFHTKEEVPHQVATLIRDLKLKKTKILLSCQIILANENQKKIVLGRNGQKIRIIRLDSSRILHKLFKRYINLKLEIKVIDKWFQNHEVIKKLNLIEENYE